MRRWPNLNFDRFEQTNTAYSGYHRAKCDCQPWVFGREASNIKEDTIRHDLDRHYQLL
jgi:hypothetical protein